jgi:sporulation protein YlmC with PRC-barrel domain
VASEERMRELEEKYEGYTVYDNRGERIGKVDDLFIDEADREEYIGVKMGFLGRKSTLIPMDIVRVNEADRAIEVSESKDHVKDAPSFDDDQDITPEYEERIRSHFGLQAHDTSGSRGGTYAGSSGATAGAHEGRESDQDRDDSAQGDRTDSESSAVDTEYGERTGAPTSSTAGATGGAAGRFERGSSTEGSAASRESTAEGEASGTPRTRETEETETFEEGGRTKVRRRIVREEIIEEDSGSSS